MKNARDLITQLYTIRLTNYNIIFHCAQIIKSKYKPANKRLCDSEYKRQTKYAQKYLEPVFDKFYTNHRAILDGFQTRLFDLLKQSQNNAIIDNRGNILKMDKFIESVLKQCKLPNFIDNTGNIICDNNNDLFHTLTNADIPHLIIEQIYNVFNYGFENPYSNGKIRGFEIINNTLINLGYKGFTTYTDIKKSVGTNGYELAKTIRDNMFGKQK